MSSPIFNSEVCIGCGLCVSCCNLIRLDDKASAPYLEFPQRCIGCGHCVALCPKEAISHPDFVDGSVVDFDMKFEPKFIESFLKSKRSIRNFKNSEIERVDIEKIIELACQAPTDYNSQDHGFIIYTDKVKIDKVEAFIIDGYRAFLDMILKQGAREDSLEVYNSRKFTEDYDSGGHPIFKGASCVVFMYANSIENDFFAINNATVSQTYMMLQAHAMGIGSCIIGRAMYAHDLLGNFIGIPEGQQLYNITTLGYPKFKYRRSVGRKEPDISWN